MNKNERTNSHKSFNENKSLTLLNFVYYYIEFVAEYVLICVKRKMCYTLRCIVNDNVVDVDYYYSECNAIHTTKYEEVLS